MASFEQFVLAVDDPFLDLLIGTMEEPAGSTNAMRAGRLTLAWWDEHGTGPSRTELFSMMYPNTDWDGLLDDPGRLLVYRREQCDLLQRWLLSYWARLGTIAYVPGHDDVVRPGRIDIDTVEPAAAPDTVSGSSEGGGMREIVVGDRTIVVTHVKTESSEYGDIQRYRIEMSGLSTAAGLAIMRSSSTVDARVMASAIDAELLRGYEGSADHGLLRDPGIREWRDTHRALLNDTLDRLRSEILELPPEPVTDGERILRRAFGLEEGESQEPRDA